MVEHLDANTDADQLSQLPLAFTGQGDTRKSPSPHIFLADSETKTNLHLFIGDGGAPRCQYKRRSVVSNGSNKRSIASPPSPDFSTYWCTSKLNANNQTKASVKKNFKGLQRSNLKNNTKPPSVWHNCGKLQRSLRFILKDFSSKCRLRVPDSRVNLRNWDLVTKRFLSSPLNHAFSKLL